MDWSGQREPLYDSLSDLQNDDVTHNELCRRGEDPFYIVHKDMPFTVIYIVILLYHRADREKFTLQDGNELLESPHRQGHVYKLVNEKK